MATSVGLQRYVLSQGSTAVVRLRLLHTIYGPSTRHFLERAGLRPGMRVVEFGCGIGTTTIDVARAVGATGQVTGIDCSAAQLEEAQAYAGATDCRNVVWHEGNAEDCALEGAQFDLAYCRFLLCHASRPLRILREMLRLLRPGGVLACEDLECSTLSTRPETAIYSEMASQALSHGERRGIDSDIGAKLPFLFQEAGLTGIQAHLWQPAYLSGIEKEFWSRTIGEATPNIVSMGLATQEEMDGKLAQMRAINEDPSILLLLPRQWQVSGFKGSGLSTA